MIVRAILLLTSLAVCGYSTSVESADLAEVEFNPGMYAIKTEIIMPHLETNLRYTNTSTQQCLIRENVSTLFPVLEHVSFVDCALVEKQSKRAYEEFELVCLNAEAATGSARVVVDQQLFRATLYIKMGGKNMKFSQRVNGQRIGNCN